MKELSIKEKAKRYDEAIERAKLELNSPDKRLIEYIFPELKESEDEKIRKWCISHFKECINVIKDNDEYKEYLSNKVIAWLEKQGEQKPAWSEEDKKMLNGAIGIADYYTYDDKQEIKNWLKSLKERILPQPKQEWSEEGKGNLLDVKCIIDEVWHNQYVREEIGHSGEELESLWHWLDNIWQRVEYPQKQWTPSEEQMDALHYVTNFDYGGHKATLVSLYNDLKRLLKI